MTHALRAEFLKLFTTRIWWILAIIVVLYVGAVSGGLGAALGYATGDVEGAGLPDTQLSGLIYSFAVSLGYVFPVLLGTLTVTGEYRHQTLTPTFLATPRRGVVLAAKVVSGLVMGLAAGVIAFVASVGAGAGALAIFGAPAGLDSSDTWALIGRGLLAMALWGIIGVGLGVLVRNQVAGIIIVLAFTQFVEPLLRTAAMALPALKIGPYLPGAASDALVGSSFYSLMQTAGVGSAGLDWWAGALVLLGYAVVLIVAGHLLGWRRDIT